MGGIAVCAPKNCVAKTRRICYRVFPTTKKRTASAVLFFVGRGDGITRSHLCLYVRFRLFNAFVVVYAFSFGSSGLYRFAIQTCAPCLLKQEGFAIAFSRQQKEDGISAVLFLLVEVTGFEPTTSWSRTKRATKLRYTSFSFPNNLPHREDIVNRYALFVSRYERVHGFGAFIGVFEIGLRVPRAFYKNEFFGRRAGFVAFVAHKRRYEFVVGPVYK